ncbi:hypothetical protein EYF80_014348 [Liparis tanakae]|uniref:Uncharacterized protein n=1 Tax=Liparis tanakae TaxID=230148 RepID=A0A4Z2IC13_9TELE|nr:hypothetical protein EYF80_014348 [Liparis tanakae]
MGDESARVSCTNGASVSSSIIWTSPSQSAQITLRHCTRLCGIRPISRDQNNNGLSGLFAYMMRQKHGALTRPAPQIEAPLRAEPEESGGERSMGNTGNTGNTGGPESSARLYGRRCV